MKFITSIVFKFVYIFLLWIPFTHCFRDNLEKKRLLAKQKARQLKEERIKKEKERERERVHRMVEKEKEKMKRLRAKVENSRRNNK